MMREPGFLWLALLLMGGVTFLTRLSMIALLDRVQLPDVLGRALRYAPPAVLAAIVLPAMVQPAGVLDVSFNNGRLLAGVLAGLVAWFSRNTVVTIVSGLLALWILAALGIQ